MFQSQKYLPLAIHESVRWFYLLKQSKNDTAAAYLNKFTNIFEVIMATKGSIGNHKEILETVSKEQ